MINDTEFTPHSPVEKYPWATPADFQEAAGLDEEWYRARGGLFKSDPVVNPKTPKLTFQEFSGVFESELNWYKDFFGLTSLAQIAIIDVTKIHATMYDRGLSSDDQDPDLPPQPGIPLSEIGISGENLGAGMNFLAQTGEVEEHDLEKLYPYIASEIKTEMAAYPQKPELIFVPAFLHDSSPLVRKFPDLAKELGVRAFVYMHDDHGGDPVVVHALSK